LWFWLPLIAVSVEKTFDASQAMNDEGSQHSDPTNSDDPIVPTGMLPEYLSQAFGELYAEDGLLVLGKGLGCLQLLASFVRFYADTEDGHLACVEEEKDETRKRDCATRSEMPSLRSWKAGVLHRNFYPP
jgi:hypothetical protein